jgi:hypothetical protein
VLGLLVPLRIATKLRLLVVPNLHQRIGGCEMVGQTMAEERGREVA